MMKKNLMLLCVFIAAVWMAVPPEAFGQLLRGRLQQRQQQNATPKIHMLFVWGTKATDTQLATKISAGHIDDMLGIPVNWEPDLTEGFWWGDNLKTYLTLDGDDATPQNIIDACRQLARNAAPNDAVFVYILCHGASVYEDEDTDKTTRIHALSPIAETAENMDLRTTGIRRSTILQAMKSGPTAHRLTMLITDSCSALRTEPLKLERPQQELPEAVPMDGGPAPILVSLLLSARGTININSSNPFDGSMNRGELALGWVPSSEYVQEVIRERIAEERRRVGPGNIRPDLHFIRHWQNIHDNIHEQSNYLTGTGNIAFSGTVFTNAFVEVAGRQVSLDSQGRIVHYREDSRGRISVVRRDPPYSAERFLADLRRSLDEFYKATKGHVHVTNGGGLELFMQQPTQTLTHFDERGVALP